MTTKRKGNATAATKQTARPQEHKNSSIDVAVAPGASGADFAAAVARKLTQPEVGGAGVIEQWQKDTHDVNALAAELGRQVEAVNGGDLRRAEGMLIAQAHTLNEVFNNLMRKAVNQQYLKQWEAYMRMAMKAQNQCRMTLETLATIKNPPVVFARQANINNGGQQQVNNGTAPIPTQYAQAHAGAHAQETQSHPNRLLEAQDGERLDSGAQSAPSGSHSELAPVGALHRATNRSR